MPAVQPSQGHPTAVRRWLWLRAPPEWRGRADTASSEPAESVSARRRAMTCSSLACSPPPRSPHLQQRNYPARRDSKLTTKTLSPCSAIISTNGREDYGDAAAYGTAPN